LWRASLLGEYVNKSLYPDTSGRPAPFYEGRQFIVTKVPPLGEVVCVARWGFLPPTTIEQLPPREGFLCLCVFTSFT